MIKGVKNFVPAPAGWWAYFIDDSDESGLQVLPVAGWCNREDGDTSDIYAAICHPSGKLIPAIDYGDEYIGIFFTSEAPQVTIEEAREVYRFRNIIL
ncbi:hypothetical protein [Morganella morganii]|uniref:hypothetical protein n=1 Tax=Morganella morganii TaxID=582 RepID=UPI00339D2600